MYSYQKRGSKIKKVFTLFILMIVVSATSIFVYDMYININIDGYQSNNNAQRMGQNQELLVPEKTDMALTLEQVTDSVVGISKIKNTGNSILFNNSTEILGLGSGIIVSENGYIVTNWHVAGNKYSSCYVTLYDGNVCDGSVLWADTDLDLAVVKINKKGLPFLNLGDSDNIKLGEPVYAIGNPIGIEFQRTVTSGIISGLNRTIKIEEENKTSYMEDLVQTDAGINPGNSGGPLINMSGQVIGINSIKITTAEGIGFAIPINIVKPIIESFTTTSNFEEATFGIFAYDKEVIPYLDANVKFNSGIYVVQVAIDGPSGKSGIKIGDIITKVDGIEINQMSELRKYIYTKKPNDTVKVTVMRDSKEKVFDVVLGKK